MIGSIRSMFWLFGWTCRRSGMPSKRWDCPGDSRRWSCGFSDGPLLWRKQDSIIDIYIYIYIQESYDVSTHCIADLYPFNRPQTLPENVLCLKAKSQKNVDKTICHSRRKLGESLNADSDKLWFRGLSTVHFYDPFCTGHQRQRQRQFVWSRHLYREGLSKLPRNTLIQTVLWWFSKTPDFWGLDVWQPDVFDWGSLTHGQPPLRHDYQLANA